MTMTTVAVAPGSLGAPPAMLTPKRYHLQQGMSPNSPSPTSGKNYDTLSKGKKSWSVRLGLSRQNQASEDPGKGWGTISGGSVLSRQMIYSDPWLYGTVRSQRVTHDPRAFLTPPPPGAPVLIVCSCPEFLSGTTRKLGNCRKCGGHRLAGIPLGGTCRVVPTSSSSRSRPSLAGVLRSSVDDPYDLVRRSRLVEPRSRARSISPHRQPSQRDARSQSVARSGKDRKGTSDGVTSRSEWFDTEVNYEEETSRRARPSFTGASSDDWLEEAPVEEGSRIASGRAIRSTKRTRNVSTDWLEASSSPRIVDGTRKSTQGDWDVDASLSSSSSSTIGNDSRKSILECDVNPYLLVKKQLRDEDDLSDDLSDNALELEEAPSTLFDPSKVKSIERIPNRSAVAAIGGQRIRVFNETREISDEEEIEVPATRIPIPKVIPKRPPRRQKETRTMVIRSILKKGKVEGKRKNVLFNVDNVIFAPEKMEVSTSRRTSKSSIGSNKESDVEELIIVPEEQQLEQEKPKFITIPNIKDIRGKDRTKINETRIVPRMKIVPSSVDRIKIDKFVPSQKSAVIDATSRHGEAPIGKSEVTETPSSLLMSFASSKAEEISDDERMKRKRKQRIDNEVASVKPEDETELEIEIEELKDRLPKIAVDEKDLILKSEANSRRSSLKRSQSERTVAKPELTAGNVLFADTMRLSLCKRSKDSTSSSSSSSSRSLTIAERIEEVVEKEVEESDEEVKEEETILENGRVEETPEKVLELLEKEAEPPPNLDRVNTVLPNLEHFRKMRPTSWSPPPGKHKRFPENRISDPGSTMDRNFRPTAGRISNVEGSLGERSMESCFPVNPRNSFGTGSAKIEIGSENVCKITVSPLTSPLVHRLQIGSELPGSGRRTSIMINGDQDLTAKSDSSNNKVTISVGGENSVCNPTVISVNSDSSPKIQSFAENRTLVILDNYRSNIVVESPKERSSLEGNRRVNEVTLEEGSVGSTEEKLKRVIDERSSRKIDEDDQGMTAKVVDRWSSLSKEAVISKLLEDSLKKARENGEILDETSGEAILKILKQTLLKSKEYESSESTIEPETNYSRSSSINSESDFVSTNLFLEENPYEIIKEPIYEEIPDEPPPLPSSPPPTEDYLKDRIYFGDEYNKGYKEAYYKKVNAGQFLRSYLPEDFFKKPTSEDLATEAYISKSHEDFFKKSSSTDENFSTKFELLNFLMDSKAGTDPVGEEDEDEDEEEEEEGEEDAEGELDALYEQKETSLGDLSSKSSQISNVSDSSEECNVILTSSPETSKTRTVDIERTDSGVGSESSQASSTRGVARRWRTGNASSGPGSLLGCVPQVTSGNTKLCEDCEQRLEPLITDSGVVYAPFVCRKCSKKRAERKEIITEIVETEQKYGRDLQIILEEFHRPMLRAGLLTQEQLSAIFLNVEELLEHNALLAEKLRDALEFAQESGDEDLVTVDVGKIFLESERMLHAFENYCTRQGSASLLLQNLEKEKELLRIFLKVSQMENTVLRRMNLNSFLMVPVQRVTKYPLLLARLLKATPSVRPGVQEAKKKLKQAQTNIELHLEHMNAEAKDVTSTKLWRRISIIQNGRRTTGEQDMVNIKLRKMAVEVLEWAHEEARFVLEGRLLVAQPTDNNWRRGRTVKLAPVTAMLVTNGKPNTEFLDFTDDSLFPRQIQIKEATLLLVKEKIGRYSLLREPLYLDKCIVCCETDLEDYFEIQELSSKETFIFKAEDGVRTKRWCRTLQAHAQSLGAWRRRRGALPNIMICGVARS